MVIDHNNPIQFVDSQTFGQLGSLMRDRQPNNTGLTIITIHSIFLQLGVVGDTLSFGFQFLSMPLEFEQGMQWRPNSQSRWNMEKAFSSFCDLAFVLAHLPKAKR